MARTGNENVVDQVRRTLQGEPRIALARHPIAISFADGALTLEGEVADIAAKKLALEKAAALPPVSGIVDRLHVAPSAPMGDKALRDAVHDALLQEPALANCALSERVKGAWRKLRVPIEAAGEIRVEVSSGVVTLNGAVPGHSHKRLAGVLCWWVPGTRDVINGLAVDPAEPDNDAEITDAVRLVLEKDPFVNAGQIQVGTHDCVVTLRGMVPTPTEREMAEFDAWFVFGVDKVLNELAVGS